MELALVLRELWTRKLAVGAGVLVAIAAAVLSVYRLDGFGLKPRSLSFSSASTQVLIDTGQSAIGDTSQNVDPLLTRATVYANLMAGPAFLDEIGSRIGLSGNQIYAAGPVDSQLARTVQEPTALKRNVELTGERMPYKFNFDNDPNLPEVGIFAQAPTTKQAIAMANAAAATLAAYVARIETTSGVPVRSRVAVRQLGAASGAVVNGGVSKTVFGLVFIAVLSIWCVGVLAAARFRENWRASAAVAMDRETGADGHGRGPDPAGVSDRGGSASQDGDGSTPPSAADQPAGGFEGTPAATTRPRADRVWPPRVAWWGIRPAMPSHDRAVTATPLFAAIGAATR